MKLLKKPASIELKFPLDLSRGDLVRLKSPNKATGPEREAKTSARESRKTGLKAWRHGP
jgi:hypothetical protein